jgi:uncharacterized protein YbaR (Trm112 family)
MTSTAGEPTARPGPTEAGTGGVDPRLLELLVCPVTRGALVFDRERGELISRQARLAYPIRDGIPIMLADEARSLDDEELRRLGKPRGAGES